MRLALSRTPTGFLRTYGKVIALIVTMVLGALLPQASSLTFLVQYILMAMLFNAFLDLDIDQQSYINPLVAMGPTFYVLYHNLYNTWQIYRFEKRINK